jgi:phosphatidylinositol-3-phosphatase
VSRRLALLLVAVLPGLVTIAGFAAPVAASAAASPIRHVFVIVLENESASTSFGPASPAPYLSTTLRARGAYLPKYYGIGHASNDNYIAMISGQAPNISNQEDCQLFSDFPAALTGANGQEQGTGCVYPANIPTIASQLSSAGFSWEDYNDGMGSDPTREASECGHPAVGSPDNTESATAADEYATRHNPFVYFHSIIDNTTLCDTHVVNLSLLPQDLASPIRTANYTFITPDLCNDGHDAPCKNGDPGGLAQADSFLRTWVPQITGSPAFKQNGLLIITFDEAATSDASSCCGEIPGPGSSMPGGSGPGGGDVGAVLLSPCITPGTVSQTAYNHYTMLRSVEDIFGVPHIAYAGLPGETSFGTDIFNHACGGVPVASIHAPPLQSAASATATIALRWSAGTGGGTRIASYTVQVRDTSVKTPQWRTLLSNTTRRSLKFHAALGHSYQFRVQAVDAAAVASAWVSASTLVPSGARPPKGHFGHGWTLHRVGGAWQGHAISSSTAGASFTLLYTGGSLSVIGETSPAGGRARVTVDGRSRTVRLHSSSRHTRRVIYRSARLGSRLHRLQIQVLSGTVSLEGLAIVSRTG